MNALKTLARVARHRADETQREMLAAEARVRAAEHEIARHDAGVEEERLRASRDPMAGLSFGAYLKRANARRADLLAKSARAREEATHLRAALSEAFIELKKIDTLNENEAARAFAAAERREQGLMDDVAAHAMRRRG